MNIDVAFTIFSHKGPVNLPTSQRAANNAYRIVKPYLTYWEEVEVGTAQGHALHCGEGREEFDDVCKEIRERLVKDKVLKDGIL